MRLRKGSIRGRVKGDLPIVFTDEKLSAYGGIELFRRFVDRSGFADRLKQVFSIRQFDGDYGSFRRTVGCVFWMTGSSPSCQTPPGPAWWAPENLRS